MGYSQLLQRFDQNHQRVQLEIQGLNFILIFSYRGNQMRALAF